MLRAVPLARDVEHHSHTDVAHSVVARATCSATSGRRNSVRVLQVADAALGDGDADPQRSAARRAPRGRVHAGGGATAG